jgi:hypothetical protein
VDENVRNIVSALSEGRSLFQFTIEHQTQIITGLHQETQNKVNEIKRTRSILLGALSKPASKEVNCRTTEAVNEVAAEDRILESLLFPSISERYEKITEAHTNTYKWIFIDPRPEDRPWSSFTDWLKNGSDIYWYVLFCP